MIAFRIALRLLRTRRIALVAAICMAAAVAAMIVITAVMDGFRATIHAQLRGIEADLAIAMRDPPEDPARALDRILATEAAEAGGPLAATAPRLESYGLLWSQIETGVAGRARTRKAGVRIIGIDFQREAEVLALREMLKRPPKKWRAKDPLAEEPLLGPVGRIIVGRRLAEELRLVPSWRDEESPLETSRVTLMTGRRGLDEDGEEVIDPQSVHLDLLGTYETDRPDFDLHHVFLDRFTLHELRFGRGGRAPLATSLTARLVPELEGEVEAVATALRTAYPRLEIETWRDKNRELLSALDIEKTTVSIILGLIVLITAALILGLLHLLVLEKTRDIGVLRSMGMTVRETVLVFLVYSTLLGTLGAGLGTLGGVSAVQNLDAIMAWAFRNLGLEVFSSEIAYRERDLPTDLSSDQVTAIAALALGLAVASGALAAARAARVDPIKSLRNE